MIMEQSGQESKFPSVRLLLKIVGEVLSVDSLAGDQYDGMRKAGEIPKWKMRIYRLIFYF